MEREDQLAVLPSHVRQRLDELSRDLTAALGDDLVGVLVHGSVVRGDYRPGESDVDVVLVLREATFAQLDAIGAALQRARYAARIEAMIMVEREIAGAADCFPLLYDDIKQRHVLFVGRDPFSSVRVHDTHRRLRIEQELRDAQIRLRRAVTEALGAREAIGGAVQRRLEKVREPLHALLALKRVACEPDLGAVLAASGQEWGVDVTPLGAPREAPEAAHAALSTLLDRTVEDVNAIAPASSSWPIARP